MITLRSKLVMMTMVAITLVACAKKPGVTKDSVYEDAVRINPSVTSKYFKVEDSGASRDGRTLRGVVERVVIRFDSARAPLDTTVVFRDLLDTSLSRRQVLIPIQDVENISKIFPSVAAGDNGGIDVFESFNVTKQIPVLRQVPVDSIIPNESKALKQDCNCEPLDLTADIALRIRCNDRDYSRWFAAGLGRASAYADGSAIVSTGRLNLGFDAIAGYRFGETKQWLLGLTYSSGIATVDAGAIVPGLTNIDTLATEMRPLLLLIGRRYFVPVRNKSRSAAPSLFRMDVSTDPNNPANASDGNTMSESWFEALFGCMKPYGYAEVGAALDTKTRAALDMSLSGPRCNECVASLMNAKARGDLDLNWSLPVSFGFGLGVDIPITQSLDIELDLGYRNVAVGDAYQVLGFTNVPDTRRISSFQLRLGVAY